VRTRQVFTCPRLFDPAGDIVYDNVVTRRQTVSPCELCKATARRRRLVLNDPRVAIVEHFNTLGQRMRFEEARVCRSLRRAFLALVFCALAVPIGRADDRPTLRLWDIPLENDYNPFSKVTRGVFDAFRRDHPEIRLLPVEKLMIGGDVIESQFLMAMAGGTAPDVITGLPMRTFRTYLEKGFFKPLDDFISADDLGAIHPEIRGILTQDGHVYGLPEIYYAHCLFYRKSAFVRAGLDPGR